jgi:hypothetical protein
VGGTVTGYFNIVQALTVDLFPNQGSSITACVGENSYMIGVELTIAKEQSGKMCAWSSHGWYF